MRNAVINTKDLFESFSVASTRRQLQYTYTFA